jgi:Tic22-like family
MNSLVRKVSTLSLIGSAVLAPLALGANPAAALPQKDVLDKLGPVLVYTVFAVDETKKEAVPLTAEIKQGDKKFNVAWVFFTKEDAQKFVNDQKADATELQKKDPKSGADQLAILSKTVVAPDSLATFYSAAMASKSALKIQFVPIAKQVSQAKALEAKFTGVPLFRVNFGQNRNGTSFFFSKEDLESELAALKTSDAKLASDAKIEVIPLEGLIDVLSTQDSEDLKKIRILAPIESRKLLREIYEKSQAGAKDGKAAPAKDGKAAPAPAKAPIKAVPAPKK